MQATHKLSTVTTHHGTCLRLHCCTAAIADGWQLPLEQVQIFTEPTKQCALLSAATLWPRCSQQGMNERKRQPDPWHQVCKPACMGKRNAWQMMAEVCAGRNWYELQHDLRSVKAGQDRQKRAALPMNGISSLVQAGLLGASWKAHPATIAWAVLPFGDYGRGAREPHRSCLTL